MSQSTAPNIVVVMADQHRADLLGCAGADGVSTPSMDWLAAEGVRFSRTSCQGPLCMPARASFLTERYVRDHGVYTNWSAVGSDSPTYLWALREAGYDTTLIGKAHLYREDEAGQHVREHQGQLEALGFGEVYETGDKFVTFASPYTDMLAERGLLDAYEGHIKARAYQGENETGQGATKRIPMWDSSPVPLPVDAYADVWHGVKAAQWVEDRTSDDPFFLFLGFPGPHDPWDAPAPSRERYAGIDPVMPVSTRRPDLQGAGRYARLLKAFLALSDTDTMTDAAIAAMRTAYASNVSLIDDALGLVIDALRRTGKLDNTWIAYTSDHGEMGGDHGMMSKCVLYRPAVHVPLIVRPPGGMDGTVVDALVDQLDLPATLREIAGAPPIAGSAGRSLLGHLGGSSAPEVREVAISEDWGFASFETDRYRLVIDEDALTQEGQVVTCQLFDLVDDPAEDHNVVADPAHADALAELMGTVVQPFFATAPARPHPSPFTSR